MRIGLFVYNFPHFKTTQGLAKLFYKGIKVDVVFGANPVPLNFYQSKTRVSPKFSYLPHPKDLCSVYGLDYYVVKHNSPETIDLIKSYNLDLGIILGARILSKNVINAFNIGILNMHPGLIPENRGLDNLKWAIIDDLPQAVTTHLISTDIDMGSIIDRKSIPIYKDDTLVDIHLRLQELELEMMISALPIIDSNAELSSSCHEGKYNMSVPLEIESELFDAFDIYKSKYGI